MLLHLALDAFYLLSRYKKVAYLDQTGTQASDIYRKLILTT